MANYNDIKQTISTNLPDNGKGEITAARLRSTLNEFVDKVSENENEIIENMPLVIDDVAFGTDIDALSARQGSTIAAVAGVSDSNFSKYKPTNIVNNSYVGEDGEIVQLNGYSYFEFVGVSPNLYYIFPAYDGDNSYASDGNILSAAFYDKEDNVIYTWSYDDYTGSDKRQIEMLAPYGAVTLRGSLINGTFDPNQLYLFETLIPSNRTLLVDLYLNAYDRNICPLHYHYALDASTGRPKISGDNKISRIFLRANDELTVKTGLSNTNALLVVDRYRHNKLEVIYGPGKPGYRYYRANEDCYVLISEGEDFMITHNDMFDNDLQYQLATLIKNIRPSRGEVLLDAKGRGSFVPHGGGNDLVVKIPIVANDFMEYTLHTDGIFALGNVAYWYFGVPISNVDAVEPVEYDAEQQIIYIDHSGIDISGYALVTLQYTGSGSLTSSIIESTYLTKR